MTKLMNFIDTVTAVITENFLVLIVLNMTALFTLWFLVEYPAFCMGSVLLSGILLWDIAIIIQLRRLFDQTP